MTSDPDGSVTCSGNYYRNNLDRGRAAYSPVKEPATSPLRARKGNNSLITSSVDSDMAAHLKLLTFKGVGDEDMDRFWFVVDFFWTTQNMASDTIKKMQLYLAFEDQCLDWYM